MTANKCHFPIDGTGEKQNLRKRSPLKVPSTMMCPRNRRSTQISPANWKIKITNIYIILGGVEVVRFMDVKRVVLFTKVHEVLVQNET